MSTVHLLQAQHMWVEGVVTKVFSSMQKAEHEAETLTGIMMSDNGDPWTPRDSSWEDAITRLQEQHGAGECYIDITELEVDA